MILSLYLTLDCNHRCRYCYAAPHRSSHMSEETAALALATAARHAKRLGDPMLGIRFFGGEPLLRWNVISGVVDRALWSVETNLLDVSFGIATNGTLLTASRCEYLLDHDFGVGISIDGPAAVHDRNRVSVDGRGTYDRVLRKIRLALDYRLRLSLALVADPSTIRDLAESVRFLWNETGATFFTISFNVHVPWTSADLEALEIAYSDLARFYVERFRASSPVQIDFLNNKINVLLRGGFFRESVCDIGRTDLAVTPEGRIHPCLRLAAMDGDGATSIGDVAAGLDDSRIDELRAFCDERFDPDSKPGTCATCEEPASCLNWCAATNLAMTGHPARVGQTMCRHEKASVAAARWVMSQIDPAVYRAMYADYLGPTVPRVLLPAVPHGELPPA